ncbi:cation transporter [Peptacetobacter hominis]|uniref:Cation transporter n=1 Tax=Peptacetobacter hominis TaxID=2743610 RepID=A0A544QVR9_9FIRM|nr:CorA family divalent cation transporter [Peptacetobacter hominis]TQQ84776.1 cation transporter [Peptacetobacter hominis]
MHILMLSDNRITEYIEGIDLKNNEYIMLCNPNEFDHISGNIGINISSDIDKFSFTEYVNNGKYYDTIKLSMLIFRENKVTTEIIELYVSDKYIVIVTDEDNFMYKSILKAMNNKILLENDSNISLCLMNQYIIRLFITKEFEFVEKLEEMILDLEDEMMEEVFHCHIEQINELRNIARSAVKITRPLIYIADSENSENMRYLKMNRGNESGNIFEINSIDFSVDKLYEFSLSTREMADRLLDIYSSKVNEKTNSMITKLTALTAICAPITIITGIYGMNFRYMPELRWLYGYPMSLCVMIIIAIIAIHILRKNRML